MPAPPFEIILTAEARETIEALGAAKAHAAKYRKVLKALKMLEQIGPTHPGLRTHKYLTFHAGPHEIWQSYVENNTPGAWRMWWFYGGLSRTR